MVVFPPRWRRLPALTGWGGVRIGSCPGETAAEVAVKAGAFAAARRRPPPRHIRLRCAVLVAAASPLAASEADEAERRVSAGRMLITDPVLRVTSCGTYSLVYSAAGKIR